MKRIYSISASLLLFWLTGTAQAVTCGTSVTADLTLTNDLVGCPDQGLVVGGATSIVIRLNGHSITGSGRASGIGVAHSTDVVIIGPGTIKGFTTGVVIQDSNSVHVYDAELVGNDNGVFMLNAVDSLVEGSFIADGRNGVQMAGVGVGYANRIMDNRILNNSLNGILVGGIHKNDIGDNLLHGNAIGIRLAGADYNRVAGNAIVGNGVGIELDATASGAGGADRNTISTNKLFDNSVGVHMNGPGGGTHKHRYNRIENNFLIDGDLGVHVDGLKNVKTRVRYNHLENMSTSYILNMGTATSIVGNTCSPGPC